MWGSWIASKLVRIELARVTWLLSRQRRFEVMGLIWKAWPHWYSLWLELVMCIGSVLVHIVESIVAFRLGRFLSSRLDRFEKGLFRLY